MSLPERLRGRLAVPVIGAPMFIVSNPDLVIAQCCAGVVGSFPALNARPKARLDDWIVRIQAALAAAREADPDRPVAPFAVNQICHSSNDRLAHDMAVCVQREVPIIITSLHPPAELVAAAHEYGGLVFHDAINVRHARKAIEQGVDGLILVCAGAGGHAGTLNPIALVREIRSWYDGCVILSGAISDGYGVAAALAMGADLAYVGSRFIATREANASERYKQMLIDHQAADIVYTSLFTGVMGNYLKPSVAAAGLDPDNLPTGDKASINFGSGGFDEKKAWRDIWGSGQGIGTIVDAPPAAELVGRLVSQFAEARRAMAGAAAAATG